MLSKSEAPQPGQSPPSSPGLRGSTTASSLALLRAIMSGIRECGGLGSVEETWHINVWPVVPLG